MIKQFTINLNKGEGEQVLKNRRSERRSYLVLVLFALVFVVLGGLTWAQNKAMNEVLKSRQAKLERIRFELDSLKREGTKVSKDDVIALASLENERFLWARRMEKLAEVLPAGVSISGLNLMSKIFTIEALAQVDTSRKDFEIISKFIEILKNTPEFRQGLFDIRFDQSTKKVVEEQNVLIFSVECLTADPEAKKAKKTTATTTSGPKLPASLTQS